MSENQQRPLSPPVAGPAATVASQVVAAGSPEGDVLYAQRDVAQDTGFAVSRNTQNVFLLRRTLSMPDMSSAVGHAKVSATRDYATDPGTQPFAVTPSNREKSAFAATAPDESEAVRRSAIGVNPPSATISPPPSPFSVSDSRNTAVPLAVVAARLRDAGAAVSASLPEEAARLPQAVQSVLHALAGATGALLSMVCVYPLDYLRTVQSVTAERSDSFITLARKVIAREGWHGLYRGLRSALWGMVVSWGVYFFVYNHMKRTR